MDPLTQRSATLATIIHACLLGLAFMPRGCSDIPPSTPPPAPHAIVQPADPTREPVPSSAKKAPTFGALIAAPLSATATATATTALPPLGANDLPALPPLDQLITSVRQDHAGKDLVRGDGKKGSTTVDLPTLSANPDDLIARLQSGAVSNQTLTREQRMLGTAQEFLHGRLQTQIERHWRHLLKNVTEPRLIIELKVDKASRLTYAQLVNSSGSLALDRLIQEWLLSSEFSLPPIKPDILYPFLIVVRR